MPMHSAFLTRQIINLSLEKCMISTQTWSLKNPHSNNKIIILGIGNLTHGYGRICDLNTRLEFLKKTGEVFENETTYFISNELFIAETIFRILFALLNKNSNIYRALWYTHQKDDKNSFSKTIFFHFSDTLL